MGFIAWSCYSGSVYSAGSSTARSRSLLEWKATRTGACADDPILYDQVGYALLSGSSCFDFCIAAVGFWFFKTPLTRSPPVGLGSAFFRSSSRTIRHLRLLPCPPSLRPSSLCSPAWSHLWLSSPVLALLHLLRPGLLRGGFPCPHSALFLVGILLSRHELSTTSCRLVP